MAHDVAADAAFRIRPAKHSEIPAMQRLIAGSVRGLSHGLYTPDELELCITHIYGVDTELLEDQTYFVVESDRHPLMACGGWSRRKTLFGGDDFGGREVGYLNPATDAARIRAFFVHPDHGRKGIGRALMQRCEDEAKAHGFTRMELMATLPGQLLYASHGYAAVEDYFHALPNGQTVRFVAMSKAI